MDERGSLWPTPPYDNRDEPHFLFIITPPFSGSTAILKLLNTSHRTMILQKRGEGQRLIPGLREPDRWNPDKEVDYESVKAVWLEKYQKVHTLVQTVDVVIEKSPPNMMRIKQLSSMFKDFSFIANNRNPYAGCASQLYRKHDAEDLSTDERRRILINLAHDWIVRSEKIRELVDEMEMPLVTYEQFCDNPALLVRALDTPEGVSESMDTDAEVRVKDYEIQKISNMNARQISTLDGGELSRLSTVLGDHGDLLAFFGYATM